MTRNDPPNKLEWSIRACLAVHSAQWDLGIMIVCIPTIPEILVSFEPLNHVLPFMTIVSQYLVWSFGTVFLEISKKVPLCQVLKVHYLRLLVLNPKLLLGVHINNTLSWENHINSVLSKVNWNIAHLRRIKSYLTVDVRKVFFNANILPHLDYFTIIWGNSPHINKLLKAQKRAARVILDVRDFQTPSSEMFKSLNWMPLIFKRQSDIQKSLYDVQKSEWSSTCIYVRNV